MMPVVVRVTPEGNSAPPTCSHFSEPVPPTNTEVHGLSTPVLVQFVPPSVVGSLPTLALVTEV
jgi:hypothetical protein